MTDLTQIEWALIIAIIYGGAVTGLLFAAWIKWWPDVQRGNALRKQADDDRHMAAYVRRIVREDYLRAKFDEESA